MVEDSQVPDPLIGVVLDGVYQISRLIGQGGMGSVYEALHVRLDNRVAIKLMSPDLASNPEALARFRREAQVTSQLGHPNIVHVFDFGTAPTGEPFLAMELLTGEDLEQHLRRIGRLPVPTVVNIVKQVASALAATHAKDIVHRDLKPANVFLQSLEDGSAFVKVLDFGISKVRTAKARLTHARLVMGSPQFMSPEQAMGRVDDIDHTSDQWALACIAFEAIAGRTPFVGDDVNTLLYQVVHEAAPELGAVAPDSPAALTPVFARALSKRPSERYTSIAVFAKALEEAAALPAGRYKNTLSYPASPGEENDPTAADARLPEQTPAPAPPPTAFADTIRPDQITTFSQSAGEVTPAMPLASPFAERARVSPRLVASVGGAIVLLGVVLGLALRSPRATEPGAVLSAAAPIVQPIVQPSRPPAAPVIEPVPPPKATPSPAPVPPPKARRVPVPAKPKRQLFEEL
jgi:serine/threonine protein kinase